MNAISRPPVTPIRIQRVTYQEVFLGYGFKVLLNDLLFGGATDRCASSNRILAIKAIRAELGIGLKEAVDLVNALTPEMLQPT